MTVLRYCLAALAGYLLGTVSFSNLMARAILKKDIRTLGSGNAGATNVLRNLGLKYAIPVFLGDALKAVLAAILSCLIIGRGLNEFSWLTGFTCPEIFVGGLAAVLGHNFPVFMGFKGGKGVSCSLGLLTVMNPLLGLAFILVSAVLNYYIKLYSVISISVMFVSALVFTIVDAHGDPTEIAVLWLLFVLMVFMHRANIVRLIKGEEKKVDIRMDVTKK